MGFAKDEIDYRLRYMGFDTRDVMLLVPLQAVWAAVEGLDNRLSNRLGFDMWEDFLGNDTGKIDVTRLADSYEARKALAVAVAKVVIAGRELARLDISQDEAFAIVWGLISDLCDLQYRVSE